MQSAIVIRGLSVRLGGHVDALKDVSLDLPAGRIVGFIGPSGAGKTTLIRCVTGRLRVPDGTVEVLGLAAGDARLRRRVGYMSQELAVYPDLTVRQNLAYFAAMAGLGRRQAAGRVREVLETVDLAGKSAELVQDLSGGQQQRVSLGVALLGGPELLVLDEPTAGLDPVLRAHLWELFGRLAGQGTTLVVSSHAMDEAERCDDLVLVRDGRILAHGTPRQLYARTGTSSAEQAFLRLVGAGR